jgi:hypothetical protein
MPDTTVQDLLGTHARLTAAVPGIWPKEMTGTLPTTAINSLLGAAVGRYAAAPIASALMPHLNKRKLRNMLTLGGAAAAGLPAWYFNAAASAPLPPNPVATLKQDIPASAPISSYSQDPGVQNRMENYRYQEQQARERRDQPAVDTLRARQQSLIEPEAGVEMDKISAAYDNLPHYGGSFQQPSIPFSTASDTLRTAVAHGTLGVSDFASLHGAMSQANQFRDSGLFSPAKLMSAGVAGGLGWATGRALGAVAGALFGLPAGTQRSLAKGVGLGNMAFDLLGRLAP